jgi:hypothetical protein
MLFFLNIMDSSVGTFLKKEISNSWKETIAAFHTMLHMSPLEASHDTLCGTQADTLFDKARHLMWQARGTPGD